MSYKTKSRILQLFLHVFLIALSVYMVMPYFYMISTSLKTIPESTKIPLQWLPEKPTLDGYRNLFSLYDVGRHYYNTIYITVITLIIQTIIVPMAAYAYARLEFPLKNLTFMFMMAMLMIPSHMLILPRYLMITRIGLYDTLWAVILVALPNVGGMFLLRQNFMSIPRDLDEAAMIDGCSLFGIYARILLPLVKNGIITITLFSFLFLWNDMLWPLLSVRTDDKFVLSVVLASMQGQYLKDLPMMCAGATCATVPVIILFLFLNRQLMDGIVVSGMKT